MSEETRQALVFDFIETIRDRLATVGGPVDAEAQRLFGCSPVVASGSLYAGGNDLNENHAPFVEIFPGETPIEVEVWKPDETGSLTCAPRAFSVGLRVGLCIDGPGELPPPNPRDSLGPKVYNSGNCINGERFALVCLAEAIKACGEYNYIPESVTGGYDGARQYPLETYGYDIAFGVPRSIERGAL